MRKGLLAGLSGLVAVYALGCGEEDEAKNIEIPTSIFTNGTSVAMRTTGFGVTPNTSYVRRALARMVSDTGSFTDLVMRGGVPEGGITADIAGTAAEQIKAFTDNGGPLASDVAVDACGNPQLAAFITPDLVAEVFGISGDEAMAQPTWPGVCADAACDTTAEGQWEVAFSELRGDGNMDLVVQLSPIAGGQTIPAYQGHLLSFMLSDNNPGILAAPLYANLRSFSFSGFGLVKLAKRGLSLRPTTFFQPTEVYAFPPEPRELAAADLVVALSPYGKCKESWARTFDGAQQPFGCDQAKPLILDRTAPAGEAIYVDHTAEGTDAAKLDQFVQAFEYQIKTALACPTITEPKWVREDVPGGSVELFQCPDGAIDPCIAFHDMEDFFCERDAPPGLFSPPPEDPTPLLATLPVLEGTLDEVVAEIEDPDGLGTGEALTFTYTVNGTEHELEWVEERLAYSAGSGSSDDPWTMAEVAGFLTTAEAARAAGGEVHLIFEPGVQGIVVKPAHPIGPTGTIEMGSGPINAALGLAGQSATTLAPPAPADTVPYELKAVSLLGEDLIPYAFDEAYVEITADGETHLYTDQPDRILALYDADGNVLELDQPVADLHCESEGDVRFDLTGLSAGTYYVAVEIPTDETDPFWLVSTNLSSWIQ